MNGHVFDPSRLRRSSEHLERDGYALVGRLLRERLGGNPLADGRRRVRRDPVLRAMLRALADELAPVTPAIEEQETREDIP